MKTIIAGSRNITDYTLIEQAVKESGFSITAVISGKQRGVDTLGEIWADRHGVRTIKCPAAWSELGKAAGPIRNAEMADIADALICVHTGGKGSRSMLRIAQGMGLKIYEKRVG